MAFIPWLSTCSRMYAISLYLVSQLPMIAIVFITTPPIRYCEDHPQQSPQYPSWAPRFHRCVFTGAYSHYFWLKYFVFAFAAAFFASLSIIAPLYSSNTKSVSLSPITGSLFSWVSSYFSTAADKIISWASRRCSVSYTHLDVYKRQIYLCRFTVRACITQ